MIHELRIYKVMPGRMPDIQNRFANITMNLFKKHGIKVVGFWDTLIGTNDELIYILEWESLAQREKLWGAFMKDPEWQKAKAQTEANGPIVAKVINKMLNPTPFSPLK